MIRAGCRGITRMRAGLYPDPCPVPAHIDSFNLFCDPLGSHHHIVSKGESAVGIVALSGADGAVAGIVLPRLGNDGTAGDGDVPPMAVFAAADAGSAVATVGTHLAAADVDSTAVGILAAADTSAVFTAVGFHITARHGECSTVAFATADIFTTTTDAGSILATFGIDIASAYGDIGAVGIPAATDACTSLGAVGIDLASGYGESTCIGNPIIIIFTCTDTRALGFTLCFYGAAVNGYICAIGSLAATDTCCAKITFSFNITAINADSTAVVGITSATDTSCT